MANQYSIATIGSGTGIGVMESVHGQLHAVLKNNKKLGYCISNEHICAEIARFLGLPVPPCGICLKRGHDPEHWFASLNFNLSGSALPPVDPGTVVAELPFESAGLLLFDILIANIDRHRTNLSLDLSSPPAKILSIFDHGHALFGHVHGQGIARLTAQRDNLSVGNHCILSAVRNDDHFGEWISRINALPNYLIDLVCDATVPLGMITTAEATAAKDFLKHRRTEIEAIIRANKSEFVAISQWSLLQ